jgi:hypothetical protein
MLRRMAITIGPNWSLTFPRDKTANALWRSASPTLSATLAKSCALRRMRKPTVCRATARTRLLRRGKGRRSASRDHDAGAACGDCAGLRLIVSVQQALSLALE